MHSVGARNKQEEEGRDNEIDKLTESVVVPPLPPPLNPPAARDDDETQKSRRNEPPWPPTTSVSASLLAAVKNAFVRPPNAPDVVVGGLVSPPCAPSTSARMYVGAPVGTVHVCAAPVKSNRLKPLTEDARSVPPLSKAETVSTRFAPEPIAIEVIEVKVELIAVPPSMLSA